MVGVPGDHAGEDVGGGAHLEVDLPPRQMGDQRRVLDAAGPVPEARRPELPQRLPHARRPQRLAGVRGPRQPVLHGVAERLDVRAEREPGLVSGDVQARDQAALELAHQLGGAHAPVRREVAQRAQQQARFHLCGRGGGGGVALDLGDHLLDTHAALGVLVGREAQLGVGDGVPGELVEQVLDDHLQATAVLHQGDDPPRAAQEVGEVA
jgi:hypothetical protein